MNAEYEQTSSKKILLTTLITLIVAVVIVVTAVLPAEFNIDPLKTGKLLGIAGMSETRLVGALNPQQQTYHQDTYSRTLGPFERFEYKYRLEQGATLLFDWQASGELVYDLHAEEDGKDPQEYSPSFDQGQSDGKKGSYTAMFPGIHGWYFENRGTDEVSLELKTIGFYNRVIEFRDGFENEKDF